MMRTLLYKQLRELTAGLYLDRRTGKKRSRASSILFGALYLYLIGFFGYTFYIMADALCKPLVSMGYTWLYMTLVSLIALAVGVFVSVFSASESVYGAKDNDMLLSMPIPPAKILLARLGGIYVLSLLVTLLVLIPATLALFLYTGVSLDTVLIACILPFVLPLFSVAIACLLGYLIALITKKTGKSQLFIIIFSLAFLALYFYVYSQAYGILQHILAYPDRIGRVMKTALFPFYCFGRAYEGDLLLALVFLLIAVGLMALIYLLMAHTFLRLSTANKGIRRRVRAMGKSKQRSVSASLLRKEWKHFLSSAPYMLNCALGSVLAIPLTVLAFVYGDDLRAILPLLYEGAEEIIPLLVTAAVCFLSCINTLTAPSVSLEGKQMWLLRVLPVSARAVLLSKLKLHLLITLPPVWIASVALSIALHLSAIWFVLIPLAVTVFVVCYAELGLLFSLLLPNLSWTSETVAIKQGIGVLLTILSGYMGIIVPALLYVPMVGSVSPLLYLSCATLLLAAFAIILFRYFVKQGGKRFARIPL